MAARTSQEKPDQLEYLPPNMLNGIFKIATLTRSMSRRRLVAATVLFAWFATPAMAALSTATGSPHDQCSGHVCQCRRQNHCPPKRPEGKGCHEAPVSTRPCEMSSRCNHESDPLPVASRTDSILSPVEELRVDLASGPTAAALSAQPRAGHTRLDPQPPRVAS